MYINPDSLHCLDDYLDEDCAINVITKIDLDGELVYSTIEYRGTLTGYTYAEPILDLSLDNSILRLDLSHATARIARTSQKYAFHFGIPLETMTPDHHCLELLEGHWISLLTSTVSLTGKVEKVKDQDIHLERTTGSPHSRTVHLDVTEDFKIHVLPMHLQHLMDMRKHWYHDDKDEKPLPQ